MGIINKAQLTSKIQNPDGNKVEVTTSSNSCLTNKIDEDVSLVKTSAKDWALPKEKVKLTTQITNNTNANITNFTFKETLGKSATFVPGTVTIGDEPHANFDPTSGFVSTAVIGGFGAFTDISYEIEISQYPEETKVKTQSQITFTQDNQEFSLTSNEKEITILENEVYILKECTPSAVVSGNEMTYSFSITNDGTLENTDVFFSDPLPSEVTFVEGSVKIDGAQEASYNPTDGFSLPNIAAGSSVKVEFKVKIN